jgi:hypothetical protein
MNCYGISWTVLLSCGQQWKHTESESFCFKRALLAQHWMSFQSASCLSKHVISHFAMGMGKIPFLRSRFISSITTFPLNLRVSFSVLLSSHNNNVAVGVSTLLDITFLNQNKTFIFCRCYVGHSVYPAYLTFLSLTFSPIWFLYLTVFCLSFFSWIYIHYFLLSALFRVVLTFPATLFVSILFHYLTNQAYSSRCHRTSWLSG